MALAPVFVICTILTGDCTKVSNHERFYTDTQCQQYALATLEDAKLAAFISILYPDQEVNVTAYCTEESNLETE